MAKTCTAETKKRQQKGPTGPANAAEAEPLGDLFPGRKSCRIQGHVAAVTNAECKVKSAKCPDRFHSTLCILNSSFRKEPPMKPVIRYQSRLLPRRSYKPSRAVRIRPVKVRFVFHPVRFGTKPKITNY